MSDKNKKKGVGGGSSGSDKKPTSSTPAAPTTVNFEGIDLIGHHHQSNDSSGSSGSPRNSDPLSNSRESIASNSSDSSIEDEWQQQQQQAQVKKPPEEYIRSITTTLHPSVSRNINVAASLHALKKSRRDVSKLKVDRNHLKAAGSSIRRLGVHESSTTGISQSSRGTSPPGRSSGTSTGRSSATGSPKGKRGSQRDHDERHKRHSHVPLHRLHEDLELRKRVADKDRKSIASAGTHTDKEHEEASSWEYWWIHSQNWKRQSVLIILIIFCFSLMHFVVGLHYLRIADDVKDPYVCTSKNCKMLSEWINSSISEKVSPCTNFYEFMCDSHNLVDKGSIFDYWHRNFARLESQGATILSDILEKSNDQMGRKVIQYYQTCLSSWEEHKFDLPQHLKYLIEEVMGDFDLWEKDPTKEPTLEVVSSRLINFFGDFGIYKILDPLTRENVLIEGFEWHKQTTKETIGHLLPIIYDALKIKEGVDRSRTTKWMFYLVNKAETLIQYGFPNDGNKCPDGLAVPDSIRNFKLLLPIIYSTYGKENIRILPDGRIFLITNGSPIQIPNADVGLTSDMIHRIKNFLTFLKCWDTFSEKVDKKYYRAAYATLFSLRILIELVHDADDETARKYKIHDEDNQFFIVFQRQYYGRQKTSRCFQSLQDSMGFYPVFKYFQEQNETGYLLSVTKMINESALALMEKFQPAEEGGLPWISTFYRERAIKILSGEEDLNVLIPTSEDDATFTDELPEVTDNHITNIYNWRQFTTKRTYHYWKTGARKHKLVWYRFFYFLEFVNAFETPGVADYSLLKFPASLFVPPYWENDILLADYAGSRNLAMKSWMKLITFDYKRTNIEMNWDENLHTNKPYREGSLSDGDYKSCDVLTFAWTGKVNGEIFQTHALTVTDPHFLSFRFGLKTTGSEDWDVTIENLNAVFPNYISMRTAYHEYFERIDILQKQRYDRLSPRDRKLVLHKELEGHQKYTQEQLFFMFAFRDICRSRAHSSRRFQNLLTENLAAVMQMKEFADAWHCPTGSPMNPPNQCFSGYATDRIGSLKESTSHCGSIGPSNYHCF